MIVDNSQWLVALPLAHRDSPKTASSSAEDDKHHLYSFFKERLVLHQGLCEIYQVELPRFKIGTLDSLVLASDDLSRLAVQFEGTVARVAGHLQTLLEGDSALLESNLVVNERSPDLYVKAFQWEHLKYRSDRPISEIIDTLLQEVTQVDALIKTKMAAFVQEKTAKANLERKHQGNLLTMELANFIHSSDVINDSEFMRTLMVVVPRSARHEWLAKYESLSPMVVPRSSKQLAEDSEYLLFSVTVFAKCVAEFAKNAAAERFTVREYLVSDVDKAHEIEEQASRAINLEQQRLNLIRLVKTNFGELFSCWMHLKILRLFVESVLRYGLPPEFLALIIQPLHPSKTKLLKKQFTRLIYQLQLPGISPVDLAAAIDDGQSSTSEAEEDPELWHQLGLDEPQDPYVYQTVALELS